MFHQQRSVSTHQRRMLRRHAKRMRDEPTQTERQLWQALRCRQLGVSFRRQVVLQGYIADFYASAVRLIVEVDGKWQAKRVPKDARRGASLKQRGTESCASRRKKCNSRCLAWLPASALPSWSRDGRLARCAAAAPAKAQKRSVAPRPADSKSDALSRVCPHPARCRSATGERSMSRWRAASPLVSSPCGLREAGGRSDVRQGVSRKRH